jgi:hypothetical protein
VLPQHAVERLALQPAVVVLAVEGEDLVEGEARGFLHPPVELHEGDVQAASEAAPDRGLARAAQAEKGDDGKRALAPRAGEELRRCRAQRHGQAGQLAHRDVGLPPFHLDEEALGASRSSGQVAQRRLAFQAQGAHALAESGEEPIRIHGSDCTIIHHARHRYAL